MVAMLEKSVVFGIHHIAIAGQATDDIAEMVAVFFQNLYNEMQMIGHYDIVVDADAGEAGGEGAEGIYDQAPQGGVSYARIAENFFFSAEEERERLDARFFHECDHVDAFRAVVMMGAASLMIWLHCDWGIDLEQMN